MAPITGCNGSHKRMQWHSAPTNSPSADVFCKQTNEGLGILASTDSESVRDNQSFDHGWIQSVTIPSVTIPSVIIQSDTIQSVTIPSVTIPSVIIQSVTIPAQRSVVGTHSRGCVTSRLNSVVQPNILGKCFE